MRHRIAGNRINMPEARRRAAIRSMIEGLILHEHITTTEARAKAVKAEAEQIITLALNGRKRALAHVRESVQDEGLILPLWELAGESSFTLDSEVQGNEERALQDRYPLRPETLTRKQSELDDRKSRLRKLIRDEATASAALLSVREGRVIEMNARRNVMRRLPSPNVVRKLFSVEFFERFEHRAGGYTRIIKLGRRAGDAAEMVRFELLEQL